MRVSFFLILGCLILLQTGCKEGRFDRYGNEINITNVPEFCNPCYLTIVNANEDDEYTELYHTYEDNEGHTRFYVFDGSKDSSYNVFIDWFDRPLVEPWDHDIQLRLIQIVADDQMPWNTDYEFEDLAQDVSMKPRGIYNWDALNGSFEDTGEKTDKIIRPDHSSDDDDDDASSSTSGGAGCGNLTYNGPTNDGQLMAWCKMAQAYECAGNKEGVAIVCKNIADFCESCSCPYCP